MGTILASSSIYAYLYILGPHQQRAAAKLQIDFD